ncbi:3-hydroxyacyl-CoA dehydrogenase [Alkalihalobacillus alcalophilus ATCC 27647 = CGMCC 1.3604]|uniref:3-hydroxyacyl-CoA dehydrogenase n=1 Tax=Alkalihalobacillus alcalophilus ATCC 27647 = CGMCC 1.3604 TaxID=1218173 RepID=A0A094WDJ8_ALKAL|nr:3-hydroxyacyl-CoA dehydrogenase/enoyl-CoA hydratase family protein [Alkalihalobacillus alcalophilus]KGA95819.1 3-hydroxyacyl-CoA dehydrogenase [Alkalihalobacillus alcalophilus ATCC 27647 = CGMCC 1.3604]MED1562855.1 3-hydroxyacyl-CoA dehydrogenase/enoyl-CoA hydratase family protein [Alkalihalobacillus alcalophilus]THG89602.1 3-hydroxyacyl-CoA dehydrogenase [Alkalihalobacillus alcalophilus ATCC 27647 = CGMCC 1.3604]
MPVQIRKAAVIGSGVMGAQIAAVLANAGIQTLLFDLQPKELSEKESKLGLSLDNAAVKNRYALEAITKLKKMKPAPLGTSEQSKLIRACNLTDDFKKLAEVDWIIEAVVENMSVKQDLFERIEKVKKSSCIVSSNTSGLSIEKMVSTCSDGFKKNFLGIHFFNPPRYLKLVEFIPSNSTDTNIVSDMKTFTEKRLGKTVVLAKDSPNFIANRIGTYGLLLTVQEMGKSGLTVSDVDALTGKLIGRPKSATFRTLDVVGLDTFLHVAKTVYDHTEGKEQELFDPPSFMKKLVENGAIGQKAGKGFYQKVKKDGKSVILAINPETLEYDETTKYQSELIGQTKQIKSLRKRLSFIVSQNSKDAKFIWNLISNVLVYAAEKKDDIADDIYSIDIAMKTGFGWEAGPFEMWDMIGVKETLTKMKESDLTVPAWVDEMIANGFTSFYQNEQYYDEKTKNYVPIPKKDGHYNLTLLKKEKKIFGNDGASLLDIGDDVVLMEMHSPNQSIGLDVLDMIRRSVEEAEKSYKGLVISHQGKNFCVGANLLMILLEAQSDNYEDIEDIIHIFQQTMSKIRYSAKPVVVGAFGMTLGGGVEMSLPAASIHADFETYMGLVETGVGLIPGGGGNKELYLRNLKNAANDVKFDLQNVANKTFETIAMASVSTSALEAQKLNYLGDNDVIIFDKEEIIERSKQTVLTLEKNHYMPPTREPIPVVGETGYATMLLGAKSLHFSGRISEHDLKIAEKLAFVIAGGRVAKGTLVDEQYLLDIEREAFLSLVAEPKTQQRMQHMLMTKKPLRN